ncbi:acyl-CoA reductase [Emticicia sp. 21SJ11W-3]|uniref:acyl-CoA reductase n=1 Tax=Emticicia sp. 21SJ11W-3 TaxID=2916755 RepID=UPI00209F4F3A|nr:acyl-CoA reductase [Emticicia sp. 21SJ11W-3]UTA70309.1 acyl-CoA reductase [Emticicia sp. 21SJ11W-3]
MQSKDFIVTFSQLGDFLLDEKNADVLKQWSVAARNENAWFTEDNVLLSIQNIARYYLNKSELEDFVTANDLAFTNPPKNVGIVMAGNIPLVGFHDLLCVVLSGNIALIKLSSSDSVLMRMLIARLIAIKPAIEPYLQIADKLNTADAVIATGSDNTAKHFEYYFSKIPHIIRKNRTSVAVLTGDEARTELANLGNDIFQYFGLGCRNVSKLYVPAGYTFDKFYESIEYWSTISIHHKYNNNYDYNKSVLLVNRIAHFDNGFLLLREEPSLVSPISVCYFEYYENDAHLKQLLAEQQDKIQCIVSGQRRIENSFDFGEAQCPKLNDFADGVNTLSFLKGI